MLVKITKPCFALCPTFGQFKASGSSVPHIYREKSKTNKLLAQVKAKPSLLFQHGGREQNVVFATWSDHRSGGLEGQEDQMGKAKANFSG